MSLADLFNINREPTLNPLVHDDLTSALHIYMNNNGGFFSESNYFRPSSIAFLCPRQTFFQFYNPKESRFEPKIKLTVDLGTIFHKYMQNTILSKMGILKGIYKNIKTGEIKEGFHPDPTSNDWEYEEYTLKNDSYNLVGHIDGIISLSRLKFINDNINLYKNHFEKVSKEVFQQPEGDCAILDMKSVSQRNFQHSKEGKIADYYKVQSNLYMFMSGYDRVYFLYTERENFSFSAKIYHKEQSILDNALNKIIATNNQFLNGEPTHEYRACTSEKDKRAKECPHREICFNYKTNYKELIEKSPHKHSGIKLPILD